MSLRHLTFATAVLATLAATSLPLLAQADDNTPAPAAAASAPPARAAGPLARTPEEQRDEGTVPDLRPAQAALPQVRIPLGRTPAAATPARPAPRRSVTPAAGDIGGIGDAAARCEALASATERAACRTRRAHETKPR